LNPAEQRRHKWRNRLHSLVLLSGMVGLLALCGFIVFGPDGLLGVAFAGGVLLLLSPQVSPDLVLRMYQAEEIGDPELVNLLNALARRADLPSRPRLALIDTPMMNAFAVGHRDDAVIAVTLGLLTRLSLRELAGVMAHEISHVRNDDLRLMGLADLVGRLTVAMSYAGVVLVVLFLPASLLGAADIPWLILPLLLFAPQLTVFLQLALSRSREFDADLDAAGLTGDPDGLASALIKLERQRGVWEQILMPGYRLPEPSVLRTHPPTAERVARLRALVEEEPPDRLWLDRPELVPRSPPAVVLGPRHRLFRPWY
jgi:heat shock protein HtpX